MTEQELNYIEEAALFFEQLGLTRMAGRVFGYLVVTEKDAVSFDDVKEALQASKGSISGTMKQLVQIQFVKAVSIPGDRKTYYKLGEISMSDYTKSRLKQFYVFRDFINKGRDIRTKEGDKVDEWMIEVSAFYDWLAEKMEKTLVEWEENKDEIIKQRFLKE